MNPTFRLTSGLLVAAGLGAAVAASAQSLPVIDVYATSAPNIFGSPSFPTWQDNAIYALENGLSSYGTPGTPTYFSEITGPIVPSDNYVTSFNSWRGSANPGADFGPAFAGEFGNRIHFAFVIDGNGTQFSISQLSFSADSTPISDLTFAFGEGTFNYSSGYVGILKGPDGILGTADDVYVTSGPNTQLVDALVGRGAGNAWWPSSPSDIDALNAEFAEVGPFDWTGGYSLDLGQFSVSGSATVDFMPAAVPEPSTYGLVGAFVALALAAMRRRSRRA